MSILIITNSIDLTVDSIIHQFNNKVSIFRFNTDRFFDYDIKITKENIVIRNVKSDQTIDTKECFGVYYRKIKLPDLTEYEVKYRNLMYKEMLTVIEGIAENTGSVALTRPSIIKKADNKIVQLKVAKDVGFNIPDSLITNSNLSAQKFLNNNDQSIIKPISVGRIYDNLKLGFIQTNMVREDKEVKDLELSPAYFQSYVKKEYEIRLTVVAGNFFGVKIESTNKIDWRKKDSKIRYSKIEVPEEVKLKCREMMYILELEFAAFDFIVNNEEYIFLELNANGQWQWLEDKLNLGITVKIIEYLTGEKKNE